MDFDTDHPNNTLGGVPFPPASATDILAEPRLAMLLFELTVVGREQSGGNAVAPSPLAAQLPTDPDPADVAADLDRLVDFEAATQDGTEPAQYRSAGYQLPDASVDLPDGPTISYLPALTVGTVAYAAVDAAVATVLEEQGYQFVHEVATLAIADQFDALDLAFPAVPDEQIEAVRPAVEYGYNRLDDDPLWDWEIVGATLSM